MKTIRGSASKMVAGDGMAIELFAEGGRFQIFEVVGEEAMGRVMEAMADSRERLFELDDAGRIVAVRPDPSP